MGWTRTDTLLINCRRNEYVRWVYRRRRLKGALLNANVQVQPELAPLREDLKTPRAAKIAPAIAPAEHQNRLSVLDGWRGISIISVLACHLLPLGPKSWDLNEVAGPFGMAIFFTLSGFLITINLLKNPNVRAFFIRRACRILPLAYLYFAIILTVLRKDVWHYVAYFLFSINYKTQYVADMAGVASPLWSLCVEVHFYLFVGLLVATFGRRGLLTLPLLALAITGVRVWTGTPICIETHLRVDEILCGATVALIHVTPARAAVRNRIARVHPLFWALLLLACCHSKSNAIGFGYLRPYLAATMIGCTLWRSEPSQLLQSKVLKYFADISYALYVIHPMMRVGWLGAGGRLELYLIKRPIGFAITFLLAHLSTFYYEHRWIEWGKKWSGGGDPRARAGAREKTAISIR